MKVSIITATHNSAATLYFNLNSVARQTYADIEHIIVDNCSTDATLQIVQQFPHVAKVISEKDTGIYDAINKGIRAATGDFIGILNSDDYLASSGTIATVVDTFGDASIDAVYGNLIYLNRKSSDKIHRIWIAGGYQPGLFYRGWMLPHPTFYVRKRVYEQFGLYDTSFRYAADYEMILRLLLKYRIRVKPIHEIMVYMLAGGSGNRSLSVRVQVNLEDRRAWTVLGLKPRWYTLYLKPMRKIWQFLMQYFNIRWLLHIPPAHNVESYIFEGQGGAKLIQMIPDKYKK
jgi:glycosyltransferase